MQNKEGKKWNVTAHVFGWVYRTILVCLVIYQIHYDVPFIRGLLNIALVMFVTFVLMFIGIVMDVLKQENTDD